MTTAKKLQEFAELTKTKVQEGAITKISNFIDELQDEEKELLKVFLVNEKKYYEIKKGDKCDESK